MDVLDRLAAIQNLDKQNVEVVMNCEENKCDSMLGEAELDYNTSNIEKVVEERGNVMECVGDNGEEVQTRNNLDEEVMKCDVVENQSPLTWKNNIEIVQSDFIQRSNNGTEKKTQNKFRCQPKRKTSSKYL